jgi:hypothetical protein
MCFRIDVREQRRPLRFCNTYVGGSPAAVGAPMVSDVVSATNLVDAYKLGTLHITQVQANLKLRRERRQAYLLKVTTPHRVRRGHDMTVRVLAQNVRGARFTRRVRVHVPRDLDPGEHVLSLRGTPADDTGDDATDSLVSVFTESLDTSDAEDSRGPLSVGALSRAIGALHRDDAVSAHFRDPGDTEGATATEDVDVLRDPRVRISGSASALVVVRK